MPNLLVVSRLQDCPGQFRSGLPLPARLWDCSLKWTDFYLFLSEGCNQRIQSHTLEFVANKTQKINVISTWSHIWHWTKNNISQLLSPLLNWLEYGASNTKIMASILVWAFHLRVGLDDLLWIPSNSTSFLLWSCGLSAICVTRSGRSYVQREGNLMAWGLKSKAFCSQGYQQPMPWGLTHVTSSSHTAFTWAVI